MISTSKFNAQTHDYPKEFFVPFTDPMTQEVDRVHEGRITLVRQTQGLWIEVDIVFCESKKIHYPVGRCQGPDNDEQAISTGMQMLHTFLQKLQRDQSRR